jgi:hypothetical protein
MNKMYIIYHVYNVNNAYYEIYTFHKEGGAL